ncbi:hypothetical protein HZB02_00345 [Candidatus Woesearchaeota archaeon]|nr:hypothetical protein [Candidatus Woesearchaeota archaeon]
MSSSFLAVRLEKISRDVLDYIYVIFKDSIDAPMSKREDIQKLERLLQERDHSQRTDYTQTRIILQNARVSVKDYLEDVVRKEVLRREPDEYGRRRLWKWWLRDDDSCFSGQSIYPNIRVSFTGIANGEEEKALMTATLEGIVHIMTEEFGLVCETKEGLTFSS